MVDKKGQKADGIPKCPHSCLENALISVSSFCSLIVGIWLQARFCLPKMSSAAKGKASDLGAAAE
jgi:hypothetical protein